MIGRIPILDVEPVVRVAGMAAKTPAKAVPGESFLVSATVFREGHEMLGAGVVLTDPAGVPRPLVRMRELAEGSDRYGAEVTAASEGLWHFTVEAWGDPIARWQHDAAIKIPIGQDTELMLAEGALLLRRAAGQITAARTPSANDARPARAARAALTSAAKELADPQIAPLDRLAAAGRPDVIAALTAFPLRDLLTRSDRFPLIVHRKRALFGSWYEFFPRSEGAVLDPTHRRKPRSGTLRTAAKRLDAIADMGFDVVYLPPVHPIGTTARKGQNNTLVAGPGDPGSPWAIGSPDGGHDAIHPDLGTLDDFDAFVARAGELGLEVAMDLALQASPDHPWVVRHPEWFTTRADGSIAYAENPPKKYQDIYPLNFDNDPEGIYAEMSGLVRHWMRHGIRIFRVDNPHTKPFPFWEEMIRGAQERYPDLVFLAEAFTRPKIMYQLAKRGFSESYTYFTWRNEPNELREYFLELYGPPVRDFFRPMLFVNTPDILPPLLQRLGRPAFQVRAILAATLSPLWGVYSGYEFLEREGVPGSEEYKDSEKYRIVHRDPSAPGTLRPLLTRLNQIRRENRALQAGAGLGFFPVDHPRLLGYHRSSPDGKSHLLVVANVVPEATLESMVEVPLEALGLPVDAAYRVRDLLTDEVYLWRGRRNYVKLDPAVRVAHVLRVEP